MMLFLIICIVHLSFAGDHSNPSSPHSEPLQDDFDWIDYLIKTSDPVQMPSRHDQLAQEQQSTNNTLIKSSKRRISQMRYKQKVKQKQHLERQNKNELIIFTKKLKD